MRSRIKKIPLFHLFTCLFLLWSGTVCAQTDPEVEAKQFFDSGQFAEALPVFDDLVRLYPTDPELNYYLGACLVETGQFNRKAQKALEQANGQQKAYWYLAQYYHANNQWENAMEAYQEFKDHADSKELKSASLDEMTELCVQHINPYLTAEAGAKPISAEDTLSIPGSEVPLPAVTPLIQNRSDTASAYSDSIISFPVNARITYLKIDQFKSEEARTAFLKARRQEKTLTVKLNENKKLRDRYDHADEMAKTQFVDSILKLEQETYRLNQEIAADDQKANQLEAAYWDNAGVAEVSAFRAMTQHLKDSIAAEERQVQQQEAEQARLVIIEARDSLALDTMQAETEPVDKIIYRIQIGAYRNTPPDWAQRLFKKLSVLRRIDQYTDDRGVTVYTVGELKSYADAQQMLKQLKMEGVNNASVAAYKNNERIPVEEAIKIAE